MEKTRQDYGSILVVDDSELNRKMLNRRLTKHGFSVTVAVDGRDALECLRHKDFDLILLDIMMPEIDGLQVLDALRGVYSTTQLPIIMVTAKASSADIIDGLSRGANDYVTKPVDFPVALARIRTQLQCRRAEISDRERQERYALAARGARDGLWDWDMNKNRLHLSSRWQGILGLVETERVGLCDLWFERVHPEDIKRLRAKLQAHQQSQATTSFEDEHRLLHEDGSYRWVFCCGILGQDDDGAWTRMAGSISDITASHKIEPLTGLLRDNFFREKFDQAFLRNSRQKETSLAVLCVRISEFELFDRRFGKGSRDQLLREMTRRIQICLRPEDTLARLDSDGFVLLCDALNTHQEFEEIARQIQRELLLPFTLNHEHVRISAYLGGAIARGCHTTSQQLLDEALNTLQQARTREQPCLEISSSSTSLDSVSFQSS